MPNKTSLYSEDTTQYHVPGYNYMGPGTHVVRNLLSGKLPVNRADAIALKHDISYMVYNGNAEKIKQADIVAFNEAGYDTGGMLMKLGMLSRLGLNELGTGRFDKTSHPVAVSRQGVKAANYVNTNPVFKQVLDKYNIRLPNYAKHQV